MMNHVNIIGRLVKEPEIKNTQNGVALLSARIACDRNYSGQDKERETDFFDIVAWRGTAEFIGKYFTKGDLIAIDGHLETSSWEKDGQKHTRVQIMVDQVSFCGKTQKGDNQQNPQQGGYQQQAPQQGNYQYGGNINEW